MKTFEELECYKAARLLRQTMSRVAKQFPSDERFRLTDQTLRASRSVPANIAEGYGRHHHQENLQFCRQARGSLSETLEHLNVALDEHYLGQDEYAVLREQLSEVWRILNGYIAYLTRCTKDGVPTN